jgi:hypothetical protein
MTASGTGFSAATISQLPYKGEYSHAHRLRNALVKTVD